MPGRDCLLRRDCILHRDCILQRRTLGGPPQNPHFSEIRSRFVDRASVLISGNARTESRASRWRRVPTPALYRMVANTMLEPRFGPVRDWKMHMAGTGKCTRPGSKNAPSRGPTGEIRMTSQKADLLKRVRECAISPQFWKPWDSVITARKKSHPEQCAETAGTVYYRRDCSLPGLFITGTVISGAVYYRDCY